MDFDSALKDPASCFERPSEILEHDEFTRDQKLKILQQWEYDVLQREVATEENMPSPSTSPPRLAEIKKALDALGEDGDPRTGSTKFG